MASKDQISAGSAYDLEYHFEWCPKYRREALGGPVKRRCEEPIRAKAAEYRWTVADLEIIPGCVDLFVKAHPSASAARVAKQFKGFTSRALRGEFPHLRSRLPTLWSRSYFAATVGTVSAAAVQQYLDTQYGRPWRKEPRQQ